MFDQILHKLKKKKIILKFISSFFVFFFSFVFFGFVLLGFYFTSLLIDLHKMCIKNKI